MIREAINNRLKEVGVSQKKCAIDNGIFQQNFSSFLSGTRPLPLQDLERVLEYLGLEIAVKSNHENNWK